MQLKWLSRTKEQRLLMHNSVGLARTIYIRCTYGIFGLKITKYPVYIYVYIRFWPTLQFSQSGQDGERRGNDDSKYTNTRKYTHQPSSDEQTHKQTQVHPNHPLTTNTQKHARKYTPSILCRANTQKHASTPQPSSAEQTHKHTQVHTPAIL